MPHRRPPVASLELRAVSGTELEGWVVGPEATGGTLESGTVVGVAPTTSEEERDEGDDQEEEQRIEAPPDGGADEDADREAHDGRDSP